MEDVTVRYPRIAEAETQQERQRRLEERRYRAVTDRQKHEVLEDIVKRCPWLAE